MRLVISLLIKSLTDTVSQSQITICHLKLIINEIMKSKTNNKDICCKGVSVIPFPSSVQSSNLFLLREAFNKKHFLCANNTMALTNILSPWKVENTLEMHVPLNLQDPPQDVCKL